jgi:hypothetical protein
MQRFSTQSKLNVAHMTWEHIFQAIYISFSDSYLVHEISLRQKGTYAPPGRFNRPGWPHLLVESSASVLWFNRVTQWFSGEPLQTPRTRCSLRQSPLMTRLPRSPGSTFVLRLYQETVHDFVPLFLQPCGPHLTLLTTGSFEPSLLVFSTHGGLTGDDLSRLFFTCTNTSQVATCTCNT